MTKITSIIKGSVHCGFAAAILSLLFAACSDNPALEQDDDRMQLTLDVIETGWEGQTINASTRAGETLEGLRSSNPARNWDLTSIPPADVTALTAPLWTYDEGTTYTSTAAVNNTLKGGAEGTTELSYTAGLNFAAAPGNIHLVNDGENSCIRFTGVLTIFNLKAGQTVTIELRSPVGTRPLTANNVSGSPVILATTAIASQTKTVANNGSVSFTAPADINIYSISVSKAEDDGFGIYCSALNYENTQVIWDEANGWWKIGANNYNNYWQRNETGTIDVYAYAPFKTGGYTVSANKLTFVAQKHGYPDYTNLLSGGNVDLLQANASISRSSNNPAQLTFNHKLAKLTFGTITNNTGETIQLNGFTVRGTINSEAKLDLANGGWSEHVSSTTSIQLPPPFVQVVHSQAEMDEPLPAGFAAKALIEPLLDKQTVLPNMAMGRSILLIPNAPIEPDTKGKITVTVEVNNNSGETFSFPIELVEGMEKIVNITIGRNHEVVIVEE